MAREIENLHRQLAELREQVKKMHRILESLMERGNRRR
jgi:hypothetical protein